VEVHLVHLVLHHPVVLLEILLVEDRLDVATSPIHHLMVFGLLPCLDYALVVVTGLEGVYILGSGSSSLVEAHDHHRLLLFNSQPRSFSTRHLF